MNMAQLYPYKVEETTQYRDMTGSLNTTEEL
jgi:hypothetical protein